MSISRRTVIQGLAALGAIPVLGATSRGVSAQEQPATVRLDYAYYNPSSLALRRFGWLEEALQEQGIGVEWVLQRREQQGERVPALRGHRLWIDGRRGGAVGARQWLADQDRLHLFQARVGGAGGAGRFADHLGRRAQREEDRGHERHRSLLLPAPFA